MRRSLWCIAACADTPTSTDETIIGAEDEVDQTWIALVIAGLVVFIVVFACCAIRRCCAMRAVDIAADKLKANVAEKTKKGAYAYLAFNLHKARLYAKEMKDSSAKTCGVPLCFCGDIESLYDAYYEKLDDKDVFKDKDIADDMVKAEEEAAAKAKAEKEAAAKAKAEEEAAAKAKAEEEAADKAEAEKQAAAAKAKAEEEAAATAKDEKDEPAAASDAAPNMIENFLAIFKPSPEAAAPSDAPAAAPAPAPSTAASGQPPPTTAGADITA